MVKILGVRIPAAPVTLLGQVKRGAAFVVDMLADIGARMPGVSQVTITAAGASVTVTPKPPAPPCRARRARPAPLRGLKNAPA